MQPLRMHFFKSSTLGSSPSKYIIMISSSCSTAVSMSWDLISSHFSFKSSGISWYSNAVASSSPFHTMALFSTKSTTPANSSSAPIGTWITSGLAPKFLTIMSTVLKKLAPILSILLMKANSWDAVLIRLSPNSLRLRLNTGNRVKEADGTIQNFQGTFNF